MKSLLYTAILLFICGAFSCSKNKNAQKDSHKLSDEIVMDSISIDDFKTLMDKAVSENDTSDIQKLLGLAQSTYQKISLRNDAEAENFAQQVKAVILGEPYLDNLITNKDNFFFKFNNNAFEERPDTDREEQELREQNLEDYEEVLTDDELQEINEGKIPTQSDPEKKSAETKKADDKKTTPEATAAQPKDRVKNSFEKTTTKNN